MPITFTQIHQSTNNFSGGTIPINASFTGNLLAIECTTKTEYETTQQIVGYLYQFNGAVQKAYAIKSGKDVIRLELPETTRLMFLPTGYLSDSYTLTLGYTNVGTVIDGSNSVSVPEELLELPVRVTDIEENIADITTGLEGLVSTATSQAHRITALEESTSSPTWESIPDKPLVFPPDTHNQAIGSIVGLSDALLDIDVSITDLTSRVNDLEAATPSSSSGSAILNVLTANTTLEANKGYLSNTANLLCTLPFAPTSGDRIRLSTGNVSLSVKHGNSSQQVLNNNTLTTVGVDNGIILKPYADIELVFVGSNLWKTAYRARTINNFTPATVGSTVSNRAYTATAPTPSNGTLVSGMNNGIKTTGALTNGYLSNVTTGDILLTFADSIVVDQIRLCNGQANNGAGINDPYAVRDITVFAGSTDTAENLGLYTFGNTSPTEETKTITPNTSPSNTFLLRVNSVTPRMIGILELEVWGKVQTGGEVVAN